MAEEGGVGSASPGVGMRTDAVASDDRGPASQTAARFASIYDDMLPVVFGYCRARLSEHDAEDVTAEVFRATLQRLDEDPDSELGRGWFLTLARNRIVDRWRHEARWRSRLRVLAATESRRPNPIADEFTGEVVELLDLLPTAQRAALVLHHVDGHTVAEIAELLDSTPRAVESLLARGRRRLRAELTRTGGEHHGV